MNLSVTTAPASEPVSLVEAKTMCRISHDDEDALLSIFIQRAREQVENDTRRALFTQTLRLKLDEFPFCERYIELPRPPLQSVSSITYVDTSGTTQTWSSSYYTVDTTAEPGKVHLTYDAEWPTTRCIANAVTINYIAGWTSNTMPASVKHLMLLLIGHANEHREAAAEELFKEIPLGIESLIWQLRFGDYR